MNESTKFYDFWHLETTQSNKCVGLTL